MADMDCNVAVNVMHRYLDGDLPREDTVELRSHLAGCAACRDRFETLSRTESLLGGMPAAQAPADLGERIMKAMPRAPRPAAWTKWVRRHPAASAAAIFVVVMLTSFVAMWNQNQELSVSGPDLANIEVEGNTVIVPAGVQVHGDLTVENGNVRVLGDVEGNLTVIDGDVAPLASTAHIAGEIRQIDRALDWFWYKVSSWFGSLAYGA